MPIGTGARSTGQRRSRGFTIVELVVTLTLLAVLVSVAAPRMRRSPSRQVLDSVRQVVRDLESVRLAAMGQRRIVRVVFDPGGDLAYELFFDHDGDGEILEVDAERPTRGVLRRSLDRGVVFGRGSAGSFPGDTGSDAITLPGGRLDLGPRGFPMPTGTRGLVFLAHEGDPESVGVVAVTGGGAFQARTWSGGAWR